LTDEYESSNCCKHDSEISLSGHLVDNYGCTIIKENLEWERFSAQMMETRGRWKQVFVSEMRTLLWEGQPQERDRDGQQTPIVQEESKDFTMT
jgi:hypothetical protein